MTRKHRVCFLSLPSDASFPASRTLVHFDGAAAGERGGFGSHITGFHCVSDTRGVLFCFLMAPLLSATTADLEVVQERNIGACIKADQRSSRVNKSFPVLLNYRSALQKKTLLQWA